MAYTPVMEPPVTFVQWVKAQPRGILTQLWRSTDLSWRTIARAASGRAVKVKTAKVLSRATEYAVDWVDIADPPTDPQ